MNDEIKDILIIIAQKLNNKYKILSDTDYENFLVNIDFYSFGDLCRYACDFLNLSINFKTAYSGLRVGFEKIFKLLIEETVLIPSSARYKSVDFIKEYFEDVNYQAILDGHFSNYELVDNLKCVNFRISVPKERLESVLEEFYELGADIFEGTTKRDLISINCDALVNYNGLTFEINTYKEDKEGTITTEKYYRAFGTVYHETIKIPSKIVAECFETSKGSYMIETPEYAFIGAINGSTAIDFIEAMILKNKVNFKKVAFIKSRMLHSIEKESEEKTNGLQKTCGTIVS